MGLPPIRRSVTSHKVTPKEPENDSARTKPQPPSVVCERFKIEGNNYFRGGKFELAEHAYSKAIEALRSNPIPWANRAQARLKLKKQRKIVIVACNLTQNIRKLFFDGDVLVKDQ